MKPYILEEKHAGRVEVKGYKLPRKFRKLAAKQKKVERRERRKADRKALRDEWGF